MSTGGSAAEESQQQAQAWISAGRGEGGHPMCGASTRRDGDSQSLQEGAVKDGSQALAASPSLSRAWFPCGALELLS